MRLTRVNKERRALLLAAAATLAACGKRKAVPGQALPAGATVLALGDSITDGTGAAAEAAYPVQLARATGWNVVNGGVPGDTSAQALARLPALLAEHHPALVIISIGGNDFLRRLPALPLHAGGWARVLGDEKLRSDQIHANAAGYRAFAEGLMATLRSSGLLR